MTLPGKQIPLTLIQMSLAVLVAFLWAICFPFIEIGHRAATPLQFAGMRALIAGLSVFIPILFLDRRFLSMFSFWRASFWIGLTYTAMGFAGMFLADGRIAPGMATVLTNIQPFLAAIVAYLILSERLTRSVIWGLGIGFFGVFIIALPKLDLSGQGEYIVGIGYILLGALGTAIGNVLMKKHSGEYSPLALTAGQMLLGSIVLFLCSFLFEQWPEIDWHPSFILSLFVLAVPGAAVAVAIWLFLLKSISVTRLNVFTFLTPVFGLAIGVLYFEEQLSTIDIVGILIIFIGLYLIIRAEQRRSP